VTIASAQLLESCSFSDLLFWYYIGLQKLVNMNRILLEARRFSSESIISTSQSAAAKDPFMRAYTSLRWFFKYSVEEPTAQPKVQPVSEVIAETATVRNPGIDSFNIAVMIVERDAKV
jgi:hypothetical protein